MAKLDCPVPDCPEVGYRRQVYVNDHLRTHHNIGLENGKGGNMKVLRERQQEQFSRWLENHGYIDIDLFSGNPITPQGSDQDDDDDDGEADEERDNSESENDEEEDEGQTQDEDTIVVASAAAASDLKKHQADTKHVTTKPEEATKKVDRQVKVLSFLEELELMIMTADDKSGLDILPRHANDRHAIVKEDGEFLDGVHGSSQERSEE